MGAEREQGQGCDAGQGWRGGHGGTGKALYRGGHLSQVSCRRLTVLPGAKRATPGVSSVVWETVKDRI